ncbi:hypothetical protein L596_028444 [Steinernema carpocapsae]|uniref:Uncharacterized protein n=1 Tax=Steinernema carpocapsae TaxID=34508 RepID=A0A4U5LYK7_STECR|nr:hypothetical protein L596_028444 [Steinernema carpocapsae]
MAHVCKHMVASSVSKNILMKRDIAIYSFSQKQFQSVGILAMRVIKKGHDHTKSPGKSLKGALDLWRMTVSAQLICKLLECNLNLNAFQG